jgi:drug/metabolite transporter (DMT)-like permease
VNLTGVLTRIISLGAILALVVAAGGSAIGFATDGTRGLISALVGAALAFVFVAITAASVILATRLSRGDMLQPAFFGIVLGGWLLKFIVFLVAAFALRQQDWVNTPVMFGCVIISIVGSLVIDVVVIARSRMPYVDPPQGGADGGVGAK